MPKKTDDKKIISTPIQGQNLSAKNIAFLCDISIVRVGQLAKMGVFIRNEDRSYPAESVPRYIRYKAENKRGGLVENLTPIEQEDFRRKKRENDEAEKKLIPVAAALEVPEKIAAQIVPILESLPLHMKRNWPELTGDQIMLVKKAVAECRNAIDDIRVIIN